MQKFLLRNKERPPCRWMPKDKEKATPAAEKRST